MDQYGLFPLKGYPNLNDQKMIQVWQSYTGPAPQFSEDTGFTKVGKKVRDRVGEKLTDNQQRIVQLMRKTPYISAKKLSESIGISSRKVEENIRKLKIKA